MKGFEAKSNLSLRSFGSYLVLFCMIVLPMLGSAKALGPLVCVQAETKVKHDCAHCSATQSVRPPNVSKVEVRDASLKGTQANAVPESSSLGTTVGETCCHPKKTSPDHSTSQDIESKGQPEISEGESDCRCEMAPADTRPHAEGQLSTGLAFEPLALDASFESLEVSSWTGSKAIPAKPTRGPPDEIAQLGPPDRAPPTV